MPLIVDLSLHKKVGLSREKFLANLSCVEGIRTNDKYAKEGICLYVDSLKSFMIINHLREAITKGDFEGMNENYECYHAGIEVTEPVFCWYQNTDEFLMRQQIVCWLAALYNFSHASAQKIMRHDLYPPFFEEIQKIRSKHFSKVTSKTPSKLTDYRKIYHAAARSYYGSIPPKLLWDPTRLFPRDREAVQWGVHDSFGISIRRFYFSRSDRKSVMLDREHDELLRVESSRDAWLKVKHQFVAGAKNNEIVFSPFQSTGQMGSVYLVREAESGHFKIGYTAGNPIQRLGSLQTGNSVQLALVGSFPCVGTTTERRLHAMFSSERVSGEWFRLSDKDVKNIMDVEWRAKQYVF